MRSRKVFFDTYLVIFAFTTAALLVRLIFFPEFRTAFHLWTWLLSFIILSWLWESIRFINNFLDRKMPFEKQGLKRIIVQMLLSMVVVFTTRYFLLWYFKEDLPFRLEKFSTLFLYIIDLFVALGLNIGYFAFYFFNQWKKTIQRAERLEKEKTQVQFHNLINQLNPHFLFNSLSSLQSLIEEDPKLASQFLQQLSKVYRYVLQNKEKELVNLRTEKEFVLNYISLLNTRFGKAIYVNIDLQKEAEEKFIVPVTLQILIENAVKHNGMSAEIPLVIDISAENENLVVKNNLQKKVNIENSNGQGLEDLKNLYGFLSENKIEIIETEKDFCIRLPLLER
ncbi:MAG: histidine kinase [Bacteroidia bacterium]|nr:histidine kinase [Bacteroidia bacterium]